MAEELERKGDLKAAEEQYLHSSDWISAVNMYKEAEQWADAYRISKFSGDDKASKQVSLSDDRLVYYGLTSRWHTFGML